MKHNISLLATAIQLVLDYIILMDYIMEKVLDYIILQTFLIK